MTSTIIQGKQFTVDNDLNLITPNGTFKKALMQDIADQHKKLNRIAKPMGLLFWTDVKNGKASNWKNSHTSN
jgi:hypothetical protein